MLTIQLTGDALTKLIELNGGSEFVLKLRHAVMENVLRTHIKALSKEVINTATAATIRNLVKESVGEVKKGSWSTPVEVTVQPELLDKINAECRKAVDAAVGDIRKLIEKVAKEYSTATTVTLTSRLEDIVAKNIDKFTDDYISTLVERRLLEALRKK